MPTERKGALIKATSIKKARNVVKKPTKKKDSLEEDDENQQQALTSPASDAAKKEEKTPMRIKASREKASKERMKEVKAGKDPNIVTAVRKLVDDVKALHDKVDPNTYFVQKLQSYAPPKQTATAWAENATKNRSKTIPCYDQSRVKIEIESHDKTASDYINANMVQFDDFSRKYILTQYPMLDTTETFWEMVYQNNVDTILSVFNPSGDPDLTDMKPAKKGASNEVVQPMKQQNTPALSQRENAFEMNKSHLEIVAKSFRCTLSEMSSYFPIVEGQYMTIGRFFVHTRKIDKTERNHRPTIYTIELLPEGCSECHFIRIVNCPMWDSKTMPASMKLVLSMIRAITLDPLQKGPVVVHCDLGTDRSATLVYADVISTKILQGKSVDIEETFKQLRDQRAGTFSQPSFFYHSLSAAMTYLRIKLRGPASCDVLHELKSLGADLKRANVKISSGDDPGNQIL